MLFKKKKINKRPHYCPAQVKVPKWAGYFNQCVTAIDKLKGIIHTLHTVNYRCILDHILLLTHFGC